MITTTLCKYKKYVTLKHCCILLVFTREAIRLIKLATNIQIQYIKVNALKFYRIMCYGKHSLNFLQIWFFPDLKSRFPDFCLVWNFPDFSLTIEPPARMNSPNSGPGVGVTKAPFVNFSVSKIFDPVKVPVRLFASHSCLTGVTAAELRQHLSNMNVIYNS